MTIEYKFLPYLCLCCLKKLKITEKDGKFILSNCETQNECFGCQMNENGTLVLDFDPRKIKNRKEISEWLDDRSPDFSRDMIALDKEVIDKRLIPYKQSKKNGIIIPI